MGPKVTVRSCPKLGTLNFQLFEEKDQPLCKRPRSPLWRAQTGCGRWREGTSSSQSAGGLGMIQNILPDTWRLKAILSYKRKKKCRNFRKIFLVQEHFSCRMLNLNVENIHKRHLTFPPVLSRCSWPRPPPPASSSCPRSTKRSSSARARCRWTWIIFLSKA